MNMGDDTAAFDCHNVGFSFRADQSRFLSVVIYRFIDISDTISFLSVTGEIRSRVLVPFVAIASFEI